MRSLFVYYPNYISNLNPNHTLQLTTLRTSVRLYTITDVQWLLYLQDHALLLHATCMVQPLSKVHVQW